MVGVFFWKFFKYLKTNGLDVISSVYRYNNSIYAIKLHLLRVHSLNK